jgi:Replication-relaxation
VQYSSEVLRTLERRGAVGFFGFTSIPGHGKTPKVYYLKCKGFEYLRLESDFSEEDIGSFVEVSPELTWTPQMYHRLRLLDLFIGLEARVAELGHLELVRTFIEYRRVKGTYVRETTDYVSEVKSSETRIVPDGAFVLGNLDTGRRGLFLVEMDMGTERIVARSSQDKRATIRLKFEQYDRYLTSGRFADAYKAYGDFRAFTLLFVTYGAERVENIRRASSDLPFRLHPYYRLTTYEQGVTDFLGMVWKSRDAADTVTHPLVQLSTEPGG